MNPGNEDITDESRHSVVSVEINLSDRTLAIDSYLWTFLSTDDFENYVSLVCDAAAATGLVFERDAVRRWGYGVPSEVSGQFLAFFDQDGDDEPALSDHIRTMIAIDGRFPLRSVKVLQIDGPSVRVVHGQHEKHDQKSESGPDDSVEGLSRPPERLADIVANLYDEVWDYKFQAAAYDCYFSEDARAMAKANGQLSTLRLVFTDEEWESIVAPIDEKWRDNFAELTEARDEEPHADRNIYGSPDE